MTRQEKYNEAVKELDEAFSHFDQAHALLKDLRLDLDVFVIVSGKEVFLDCLRLSTFLQVMLDKVKHADCPECGRGLTNHGFVRCSWGGNK